MKKLLYLFLISLIQVSCLKEPEFHHSKLYPVIQSESNPRVWNNNEIFDDIPISIRLESRIDCEEHGNTAEGIFDAIKFEATMLTLDKDIYYLNDTIRKGENLLDHDIAEIETLEVTRGSGMTPHSYIFWINKLNDLDFYNINTNFFTIYVSSTTEDKYMINDSTVIKIQ